MICKLKNEGFSNIFEIMYNLYITDVPYNHTYTSFVPGLPKNYRKTVFVGWIICLIVHLPVKFVILKAFYFYLQSEGELFKIIKV